MDSNFFKYLKKPDTLRVLLASGMEYDEKSLADAFRAACYSNLPVTVKILLEYGADPNQTSNINVPLLVHASERGYTEVVKVLLMNGADVNLNDGKALEEASYRGEFGVVKILLEHGASTEIAAYALHKASSEGYLEIVRLLLKHGVKPIKGELSAAVHEGFLEIANILIEAGANVNERDQNNVTPLMFASLGRTRLDRRPSCVELLISKGARLNNKDKSGRTALICASSNDHAEIVRILAQAGANINISDNRGYTALDHTSVNGIRRFLRKDIIIFEPITITILSGEERTVYSARAALEFLHDFGREIPVTMNFGQEDDEHEFEDVQSAIDWFIETF